MFSLLSPAGKGENGMKKALGRIFGVIVFWAIGICIFNQVSEVLRAKTSSNKNMVHALYEIEKDTIDVLVLGSSHGYSSVQPNVLWHDYGITSLSMCSQGQYVPGSYYLLLEALKYQKPKIVLFESYYLYWEEKEYLEARVRQAFDGVRMGKVKLEALKELLPPPDEMSFKDRLSYYIPFIMYHSRWSNLKYYDFNTTKLFLKGSIQNYTVFPVEDPGVPDTVSKIPEISLEYFEKIRQTCEDNGIQLVVYAAPFGIAENNVEKYNFCMGVNNALEAYLAEENIPFLYYHKIPEAGIDFSTDFRNETHMNTYGAVKISRHLGDYFSQQFDLEDHRQDPAYESWNEDYEKYKNSTGDDDTEDV